MIKVAVWGTGMMGQGLLGYILDRPEDIELVGAIDVAPEKQGRTVGDPPGRDCGGRTPRAPQSVPALRPRPL